MSVHPVTSVMAGGRFLALASWAWQAHLTTDTPDHSLGPTAGDPAEHRTDQPLVRDSAIGTIVAALFGALWCVGAASGLLAYSRPAALVVVVLGVLVAVLLVVLALRIRRRTAAPTTPQSSPPAPGPPSMFATRRYRVTLLVEVVAIVAGGIVLGRLGLGEYAVIWVAAVVGVHFLFFGRAFWSGFIWVGAIMLAGAAVGLVLRPGDVDHRGRTGGDPTGRGGRSAWSRGHRGDP